MVFSARDFDESVIAEEILDYLVEHPHAQDTLDGIVGWWLLSGGLDEYISAVRRALAHLVARDLVLEARAPDSRVHYRLNPRRLQEIRAARRRPDRT